MPHVVGLQDIGAHRAQYAIRDSDCRTREDIAAVFPVFIISGLECDGDLAVVLERHLIAAHDHIIRLVGLHISSCHFTECDDGGTILFGNPKRFIHLHVIASERERIRQIHTVASVHIVGIGDKFAFFIFLFIAREVCFEHTVQACATGSEGDFGLKVPSIGEQE